MLEDSDMCDECLGLKCIYIHSCALALIHYHTDLCFISELSTGQVYSFSSTRPTCDDLGRRSAQLCNVLRLRCVSFSGLGECKFWFGCIISTSKFIASP